MTRRVLPLIAMILLTTTNTAFAQDDDWSDDEHRDDYKEEITPAKDTAPYVELLGSGGAVDHQGLTRVDPGDGVGGVGAVVGGHLQTWLAIEGEYELVAPNATHLATCSFKFVPIPDSRLQPYLKAGIGLLGGADRDHPYRFLGRFDAGAAFFIKSNLALDVGITAGVATHDKQVYLGNLGLIYYFE
jgi:hypothetical protein